MPRFGYVALDSDGRTVRGVVEADSAAQARRKLRADEVHPVSVENDAESVAAAEISGRRRIKMRDLATTIRQLASLLQAGMALVPAIEVLVEQLGRNPLGAVMVKFRDDVRQGAGLAQAMAQHPDVFPDVYVSMIEAGEMAGALENVLVRLAEMTEQRLRVTSKVKAALAYPLFMLVVGTGVIIFLLTFVVPSITRLFTEMHQNLPLPTVVLISISDFLSQRFMLIAILMVVLLFAVRISLSSAKARLWWDSAKLKLPLFGPLILKTALSRFARTLGVMLASGVPILAALDKVRRVVGNSAMEKAIVDIGEQVSKGGGLAGPMQHSGIFPPVVVHMVATGEAGGNVEEGLLNVADAYDAEIETTIAAMLSLLEPAMILIMGAAVGFIVLAVLLPIFEINQIVM